VCGLVARVCGNACEHAYHNRRRSQCSLGSVLSASCIVQLVSLASAVGQPCRCCGPTLASCTWRPQRTSAARSLVTVEEWHAAIVRRPVFCECEFTCADWDCGRPPAHRQRRWHALTVLPLDFHAKGSVSSADASSRHSPPRQASCRTRPSISKMKMCYPLHSSNAVTSLPRHECSPERCAASLLDEMGRG
jgi:hypothetical protein